MLHYIDRERDRHTLLKVLQEYDADDVQIVARGLRVIRFRDADETDEQSAIETKKPTSIEAAKPDLPPEDGPTRAA